MKKCKACQSEIDEKATKCAKCGSDQRGWFKRHPIITGILVFIIVMSIGGAVGDNTASDNTASDSNATTGQTQQVVNDSTKTEGTKAAVAPAQAEKVDLAKLMDAFDENQLDAEEQYKGKFIQVTGKISNIAEDIAGNPYVSLQHPTETYSLTQLKCVFKDKSAVTGLKKGSSIALQGTVKDQLAGVIELKDCTVAQ